MARRKRKRDVSLPWERRGARLRDALAGHRWKMLLAAAVVAALSVAVWRSAEDRARVRETRITIASVKRAVHDFRSEIGRCPRSTAELVRPPDAADRYLRRVPRDAWGRDLWLQCPGRHDPFEADVVSAGPSGSFLVDDNVQ